MIKQENLRNTELFDLTQTIAASLFGMYTYPWEVLPHIGKCIMTLGKHLPEEEYQQLGNTIWIHKSAKMARSVLMTGPAIICAGAEVRHSAFLRGNTIVGENAVVGNSCELKNVILFNNVQVPHYNYVGDSILGYKAHMGAGAVTSNVKSDKTLVKIHAADGDIETELKKVGAILGDYVEVGCGSVLNPGTVVGRNSNIYPLSSVRGCVAPNSIYKKQGEVVEKQEDYQPVFKQEIIAEQEEPQPAPVKRQPRSRKKKVND